MTTSELDAGYPVSFSVERPASQSRLTNFPLLGALIRAFLLIPHLIILYFLGLVFSILYFIATFAILFTGRFPQGMFNFEVGVLRWNAATYAYFGHLLDRYPAFSMSSAEQTISYEAAYPATSNRILNLPFLGIFIKEILTIPHLIILAFLSIAAVVVTVIATFSILFTGSYPEGMHGFVVGVGRWNLRVYSYVYALTDIYPPFSLK